MNIYLSLHRFKVNTQDEYYFVASIGLLKKVTGYTKQDIYESIRKLIKLKLIKVHNVSRWDRFLTELNVPDKYLLEIQAIPITQDGKLSRMNGELLQHYYDVGLSIKHYMIYRVLLMDKHLTIEEIADKVGFDTNTVHKLIRQMNRKYVMYSKYVVGSKRSNHKYIHYVLTKCDNKEEFKEKYREEIELNISRWDKKAMNKHDSA